MAYSVKYLFKFESSNGTTREIRVLQDGYTGEVIQRPLGRAPVLKKQQNGPVHGTSLEFYAECNVDREFIEFYTSDPKAYRVDLYAGATLLWRGYITPELYSEPDIAPPYDVQVVATDGVGELKLYDYAAQGAVTLRTLLSGLLSRTGLGTDIYLISSLKPGSAGAGSLLEKTINLDYMAGESCYDVLTYLLDTLHATITWWKGAWILARETNVTFTNGKVRYFNTAGNSALLNDSVQVLGKMYVNPAWPVGQLSTVIDPAKNRVTVQAPWHVVTCLRNSDMTSDASWAKSNDASYGPDGYLFPNNDEGASTYATAYISQALAMEGLRVPMSFELRATGVSAQVGVRVGAAIGVLLTYTVENVVYHLRKGSEGTPEWTPGPAIGTSIDGSLVDYQRPLASFDMDRIQAETLQITEIPAFVQGTSYPSGMLTVYILGTCARVYAATLDVVLPKGYQDILRIDNGARGEGGEVEIAIGRVTADNAYYAAFLQGLLLDSGNLITSFSDANFPGGMDYLAFIARDYALSVALPRAKVTGTVYLESGIAAPPLVFTKGALNYWLQTWSWNLYEDELEIEGLTLPSASLTVESETILESTAGASSSSGRTSGGGGAPISPGTSMAAVQEWVNSQGYLASVEAASTYATITALNGVSSRVTTLEGRTNWDTYFGVDENGDIYVKKNGNTARNFYSWGAVSAGGLSSGGGSEGASLPAVWASLKTNTDDYANEKINAYHIPIGTGLSVVNGLIVANNAGTVTSVKVGTTTYNPTDGVVSLPAYPTSLPASDVYAWAKAETKPSYAFSEITGTASTSQIPTLAISKVSGLQDALDGKQPLDADLTYIAGLTGTSGFLKKTAASAWALDTNTYLTTSSAASTYATITALNGVSGRVTILEGRTDWDTYFGVDENGDIYVKKNGNTARGFYSYGFVSAGGASSGGGTAGADLPAVWTSLRNVTTTASEINSTIKIAAAHIPDMSNTYGYLKTNDVSGVYLPLTGGTMSNTNIVTNLNADLLDGNNLIVTVTDWNTSVSSIFKSSENTTTNAPTTSYVYGVHMRFHRNAALYFTDLVTDLYGGGLYFRTHTENGYGSWYTVVHSGNYTSYVNTTNFPGLNKVGTVTSVAAGTGLSGGTITTSGTISLATSGVTAGTYYKTTVDTYGRVTSGYYADLSAAINGDLGIGTSDPTDADYYIAQYAGGGTSTTSYHRRPHSALYNYINGKLVTAHAGLDKTGTVTSVATGTGLTGGTIIGSGTISINSTYQTYINHGESAYNSLGNYVPKYISRSHGATADSYTGPTYLSTYVGNNAIIERGSWAYANNGYIDTGVGIIGLAGTLVIASNYGTNGSAIFVTPSTSSPGGGAGANNEMFFFTQNGNNSSYPDAWTRVMTNRNWSSIIGTTTYAPYNASGYLPLTGGAIQSASSYARLRLVTDPNYAYIQAGTSSANNGSLFISGYNATEGATLLLKFSNIYATASSYPVLHSGNYSSYALPLTGGTLKSSERGILYLNEETSSTGTVGPYIGFQVNGVSAAGVGSNSSVGAYLENDNANGHPYVNLDNNGVFKYKNTYTFWHSGNSNLSTVPWACSTLTASDHIYMANNKYLYRYDSGGVARSILDYESNGTMLFCWGNATGGYSTSICGNTVSLRYGTSHTIGMKMDTSGNVGIGTPTPGAQLEVLNGADPGSAGHITAQFLSYSSSPYGIVLRGYASGTHAIQVERKGTSSEFFSLALQHLGGNVGIGTTSPSQKLHVIGGARIDSGSTSEGVLQIVSAAGNGNAGHIMFYSTPTQNGFKIASIYSNWASRQDLVFYRSNNTTSPYTFTPVELMRLTYDGQVKVTGNIVATGAITAGAASDARLKTNIRALSADAAKRIVMSLNPVTFTWNEKAGELYNQYKGDDLGFVAQEVENVLPVAIGTIFEKYKRLDQTKFIAPLVAVAQDHESRIRQLEAENRELRKQLNMN